MFKNGSYLEVEMGGNKYKLVANHSAMIDFFDIVSCGTIKVLERLHVEGLTARQIIDIILLGLKQNNDTRLTRDDISKFMFKDGLYKYHKFVSEYSAMLLSGVSEGDEIEGKSQKG